MSVPPPRGMSEVDYEAIEAAVTETVRGRWFLAEFARRNRVAETRQLLEAMARLEGAVMNGQMALPSADPSIRLLVQRIKEISAGLGGIAGEMRAAGVEDHLVAAVDSQARAVSGLMRAATPSLGGRPPVQVTPRQEEPAQVELVQVELVQVEPPRVEPPAREAASVSTAGTERSHASMFPPSEGAARGDPRLAALAALDALPLAEKLAIFR